MARLLIVHHSPSPSVRKILDAVVRGSNFDGLEDVDIVVREALEATPEDLLQADGYILGTTANFGYISGALKHFFDTTFYRVGEATSKRPFSYWIHGGFDTTGAQNAMDSITTGYGWKICSPPLTFVGEVTSEKLDAATELGATVAASVSGF